MSRENYSLEITDKAMPMTRTSSRIQAFLHLFGFRRGIYPGLHGAKRSIFITTAFILWAFHVSEKPAPPIDSFPSSSTANVHAMPFESVFCR
ncbi:hypothetical protein OG21DRAFT_1513148 [Imleria badia]|nr:hypothetical protein OG21DRAFT_1513148 [Imleria badia]